VAYHMGVALLEGAALAARYQRPAASRELTRRTRLAGAGLRAAARPPAATAK